MFCEPVYRADCGVISLESPLAILNVFNLLVAVAGVFVLVGVVADGEPELYGDPVVMLRPPHLAQRDTVCEDPEPLRCLDRGRKR
jgi:hypothetical protein